MGAGGAVYSHSNTKSIREPFSCPTSLPTNLEGRDAWSSHIGKDSLEDFREGKLWPLSHFSPGQMSRPLRSLWGSWSCLFSGVLGLIRCFGESSVLRKVCVSALDGKVPKGALG